MNIKEFNKMTNDIFEIIFEAFEDFDPDEIEADYHLDHVVIEFSNGTKFILNRQPPVRQIWLATKTEGYHFNFNSDSQKWLSDKKGEELFDVLSSNISNILGRPFEFN